MLTALVLTYNERENIARTLDSIVWADKILVIDSGSEDETESIVRKYPQATVISRKFTTFAEQWNFGLDNVDTPWVLSIDADYDFPSKARELIRKAMASNDAVAYEADFAYAIYGKVVRGSILPPRTVLYRLDCARYWDDGHTQMVNIDGEVEKLAFEIVHDDRKPLSRWTLSQIRYAEQEADKLLAIPTKQLSFPDKLRRLYLVAPLAVFLLVYIFQGGFLSGWRGLFYALQRLFAELLLSLFLIDRKLRK